MHEATVAFAILNKAAEAISKRFAAELADTKNKSSGVQNKASAQADDQRRRQATRVKVDIGEFRNVDPESLTFAFESLRKDIPNLENAELDIKFIEGFALCSQNHNYRPRPDSFFACTVCGSGLKTMINGEELNITAIELI